MIRQTATSSARIVNQFSPYGLVVASGTSGPTAKILRGTKTHCVIGPFFAVVVQVLLQPDSSLTTLHTLRKPSTSVGQDAIYTVEGRKYSRFHDFDLGKKMLVHCWRGIVVPLFIDWR
jgi:hypothetical protein